MFVIRFLFCMYCAFVINAFHKSCDGMRDVRSIPDSYRKDVRNIIGSIGFISSVAIGRAFGVQTPVKLRKDVKSMAIVKQLLMSNSTSFLASRAASLDDDRYEPGVLSDDVYYPTIFEGNWNVTSTLRNVVAPLGASAFGGEALLNRTRGEINSSLHYVAKFRPGSNDTIISDRLYNVERIAEASMGRNSIVNDAQLDDSLASRLRLSISPPESKGAIFDIELVTTDREFYSRNGTIPYFEALEKSSQIIRLRAEGSSNLPLRKNIETITVYVVLDDNTIQGVQRTATFLSSLDPRYSAAVGRTPEVATRAVDIRVYDMLYSRI